MQQNKKNELLLELLSIAAHPPQAPLALLLTKAPLRLPPSQPLFISQPLPLLRILQQVLGNAGIVY